MEKEKIQIGMSIDDFAKNYPERLSGEQEPTKQYGYNENLHGLDGGWAYYFENGILTWFMWDCYIEEINQDNFDKSLLVTRNLRC